MATDAALEQIPSLASACCCVRRFRHPIWGFAMLPGIDSKSWTQIVSDPTTLASQSAEITDVSHDAWPRTYVIPDMFLCLSLFPEEPSRQACEFTLPGPIHPRDKSLDFCVTATALKAIVSSLHPVGPAPDNWTLLLKSTCLRREKPSSDN
ncbi:hypothetical protein AAY473_003989 [Plecturocebus cupreus]